MKQRTNNKIVLCQNCYGTLTADQEQYCNDVCMEAKIKKEGTRDQGDEKIWIYCNKNLLDIAIGNKVIPHEFSNWIWSGHELVGVAQFTTRELETIGDKEANAYDAWWRSIGRTNISLEPHTPQVMRREGLLSYLCDRYGISTEKNIAACIGELTYLEGKLNPADFFNSL